MILGNVTLQLELMEHRGLRFQPRSDHRQSLLLKRIESATYHAIKHDFFNKIRPDQLTCCDVSKVRYAQHDLPSWIGGQGTVAYEQYTQQSPSSGFRTV